MRRVVLLLLVVGAGCGDGAAPSETVELDARAALADPTLATATAPDTFRARFVTTKGDFIIEAKRDWAPHGVDRLYNLIRIGYFRDTPFYRMVRGTFIQFGFNWDPKVNRAWERATIPADPPRVPNFPKYVTFGMKRSPDSRTTHLVINLRHNGHLDRTFAPVAKVVEGWDVVLRLNFEYREKPKQQRILNEGLEYLQRDFPRLDSIRSAAILE